MIDKIIPYLQLIRVHHWIKNLLIILPAFFAQAILDKDIIYSILPAFIAYSFVASCIYILNDIHDLKFDKAHPKKKLRPMVSGLIPKKNAIILFVFLLVMAIIITILIDSYWFAIIITVYFIINILYTYLLKNVPLMDINIVAFGFLLRIFAGGIVAGVEISNWMILMTYLLALLLIIGKRRDDIIIISKSGNDVRGLIRGYNITFIDASIVMVSSILVMAYFFYTISPEVTSRIGDNHLIFTGIFVIMGIIRYFYITFVMERSGSPVLIFWKDIPLQIIAFLWLLSFVIILYVI
jgi:decaprenyl-phosphate phosphoribosyltransferase